MMTGAIVAVLGWPAVKILPFPWRLLRIAGLFAGAPREIMEMCYLWQQPVRLDNTRFVSVLGAGVMTGCPMHQN
jgi:hypothetical protein